MEYLAEMVFLATRMLVTWRTRDSRTVAGEIGGPPFRRKRC
jgi:hypothetical protein